jgi:hypothetical protein
MSSSRDYAMHQVYGSLKERKIQRLNDTELMFTRPGFQRSKNGSEPAEANTGKDLLKITSV